ncbi:hypothetical protein [Alkanindiges illinoisensis]|uniref:hypothetical protein n=1 Tax=Alkanindiges illinoisensis TaxID=197183 RepID=UPI00047C38D5|nr:hypothetical protein [Alkanindiges illinoisensis]
MKNYSINPKEAYLLEQFSSLQFFETMRNNYHLFLDGLEELFEIYMHNLPYNLRDLPLPEQADINWGGTVLPNLRGTMDRINYAYAKIKAGDFTYLDCVGEIRSNDKGLSEFSPHWMDDLPTDKVWQTFDYYSKAKQYASIIEYTYPTSWKKDFLAKEFPSLSLFSNIDIELPASYPIYRINPEIKIKTGEKVVQKGIYICEELDMGLTFIAFSPEKDNGLAPEYTRRNSETGENMYFETMWTLVERIADEGGSTETIQAENLKGFGGEICPYSGQWWSPANQSEKRYFEQGDTFPKLKNNFWGKTIWYLEVTNQIKD